ncbi:hypothetical protein QEV83_14505 [Methylocapsa sp. D3K7]|uniref:hypothetical protein n=1 Tax=Methylocapsa sp. D3K7 TaxID=3041435 RepID=UPI00244E62A8|nr:hypothetical protein [Methylocapsa sp. D3K7]WGJ13872.1 hypothetical protein QEV83_14505 [Methylocapsa sp. D3K7]
MPDVEPEELFDTKTRDRIRRKILRYKNEHGLGVGRLAKRISLALPLEPEIPVKTLQRFLAGIIRTNDLHVGFFEKFSDGLPDPDPLGEVGKSMAALYGKSGRRDFSGVYATMQTGEGSEVTVSQEPGFWRVKEVTRTGGHSVFDGVAVCSSEGAFFVLKDRLAGLPRTYTVWPQENDELHGCGTTIGFVSFYPRTATAPRIRSFEIKLRK